MNVMYRRGKSAATDDHRGGDRAEPAEREHDAERARARVQIVLDEEREQHFGRSEEEEARDARAEQRSPQPHARAHEPVALAQVGERPTRCSRRIDARRSVRMRAARRRSRPRTSPRSR